jgi:NAD(P)-dependent dehydrogenase (short-subunit alcohol dehydrogenase family)
VTNANLDASNIQKFQEKLNMSLLSKLKGTGKSGYGYGSSAEDVTSGLDLSGKTYLVTGCNSGIGEETARVLALRGARLVAAARTVKKAEDAVSPFTSNFRAVACELSEPQSAAAAAASLQDETFDGIICNAGIMALPKLTLSHGYEMQFMTNHIGHFILVTGLLDRLADDGRVVMLSSDAHKFPVSGGIDFQNLDGSKGYGGTRFYGQSKLSNLLFARELATRLKAGQTANAVHPGVIHTNLARNMAPIINVVWAAVVPLALKSIPEGAATQTWGATHPSLAKVSGEYLADCNIAKSSKHGADMGLAKRLWEVSEEIVAKLVP